MSYLDTGLWADIRELPGALDQTLAAADGVAAAAEVLGAAGVERIVATGNGAAYYVAHALWLASLESRPGGPQIVALPCGLVARDRFRWHAGDAVLAISSSGEFRDVVEIARRAGDRPCVAITASAGSALATTATAAVLQHVASQRAVTHTQALAGAYACGLAVWAAVTGDAELAGVAGGGAGRGRERGRRRRGLGGRGAGRRGHPAGGRRGRRRHRVGGGARARADAEGDLAHPGRGRRDAGGLDVGDVRARPRASDGRPGPRRATRSATRPCACARPRGRPRCGCRARPAPTGAWRRSRPCRPPPRSRPSWRSPPATTSTGRRGRMRTTRPRGARREHPDRRDRLRQRLLDAVHERDRAAARPGPRGRDRGLRLGPREAQARRRPPRPHARPPGRPRRLLASGGRRRARAHEHARPWPARTRGARGRQARARREARRHDARGGRAGARGRRDGAGPPRLRAAHTALADLPGDARARAWRARSAGC